MAKRKFFHRHQLISPIRYVVNFGVYLRYLKEFKEDNAHNRTSLYQFDRNIQTMGFNNGVEAFETLYEGTKNANRSIKKSQLKKKREQGEDYVEHVPLTREEYRIKYNIGQKTVKQPKQPKQPRNDHDYDVDVSHVDRAMGNNRNDNDDEMNRLLDDIF